MIKCCLALPYTSSLLLCLALPYPSSLLPCLALPCPPLSSSALLSLALLSPPLPCPPLPPSPLPCLALPCPSSLFSFSPLIQNRNRSQLSPPLFIQIFIYTEHGCSRVIREGSSPLSILWSFSRYDSVAYLALAFLLSHTPHPSPLSSLKSKGKSYSTLTYFFFF